MIRKLGDDDARAVEIYAAKRALGVRNDLLANLLSARVVAFQLLREGFEHKIVFVEEKSDRLHSRTEPSRGVDARRQTEHHVLRSQFFRTREHFNAAARAFGAHFQPVICDDAVVADQGHNVRNGCDGAYVKILFVFVAEQRAHQCKRNSRAAQIRKTSASVDFGVGNDAIGQLFLRLVMVGDDKVYPLRAQIFRLFDCGDAAVHGDDEVGTTVRNDAFERPDVHSVPVGQTVGDEIVRVRTFGAQREHKGCRKPGMSPSLNPLPLRRRSRRADIPSFFAASFSSAVNTVPSIRVFLCPALRRRVCVQITPPLGGVIRCFTFSS